MITHFFFIQLLFFSFLIIIFDTIINLYLGLSNTRPVHRVLPVWGPSLVPSPALRGPSIVNSSLESYSLA